MRLEYLVNYQYLRFQVISLNILGSFSALRSRYFFPLLIPRKKMSFTQVGLRGIRLFIQSGHRSGSGSAPLFQHFLWN